MEKQQLIKCVQGLRESDETAFKILFNHFQQSIYNFLFFRLKDGALAEDILQEVFLRVWKNRRKLDVDKSFKSYLYTIASNLSLNAIRDKQTAQEKTTEIEIDSGPQSPESLFLNSEFESILASAIHGLTEKNRVTFMMSRYENLTYKEIAERLGISIKTVETRMVDSLRHIREHINNYRENRG